MFRKMRERIPPNYPTLVIELKSGDCLLLSPYFAEENSVRLGGAGSSLLLLDRWLI